MRRAVRLTILRALGALRLDEATLRTRWRKNRLLILGYHGVALDDEHQWDSELYMPASVLRRRLELIREAGCRVLGLDEAVRRLYGSDLPPPRSVVLTFDDGTYDFYAKAFRSISPPTTPSSTARSTTRWSRIFCGRGVEACCAGPRS